MLKGMGSETGGGVGGTGRVTPAPAGGKRAKEGWYEKNFSSIKVKKSGSRHLDKRRMGNMKTGKEPAGRCGQNHVSWVPFIPN